VILDFTLIKLYDNLKKLHNVGDHESVEVMQALIEGYAAGDITVMWEGGQPLFQLSPAPDSSIQLELNL
jgi:hypothetical protein